MDLMDAAQAYQEAFGDVPSIIGLPEDVESKAAELLSAAVRDGKPIGSDASWYDLLGVEGPQPDDLI